MEQPINQKSKSLSAIRNLIRSFKDDETDKIFKRIISQKPHNEIQQVTLRKLQMLNRLISFKDLQIPLIMQKTATLLSCKS